MINVLQKLKVVKLRCGYGKGFFMPEVLIDRSASGRIRPWKEHKLSNEKLSSIYHLLRCQEPALEDCYAKRAERLQNCGSSLIFAECPKGHGKRLKQAYFCKQRLCAVCSWRKTLFVYHQFLQVAHEVLKHHPDYQFVFITLSRKNCSGERLNDELTHLIQSFERLKRYKRFQVVKGTFRTNEITYNPLSKDYHPHIHAIGAVPAGYYTGKYYISQTDLIQLWKKAVQVDYDPTVDIRKVRKKRKGIDTVQESIVEMDQALHGDSLAGAAAEVAKYAVKVQDIIQPRPKRDDSEKMKRARLGLADDVIHQARVVACLDAAMNRRRMISYSGVFKDAYQSTNQTDVEQSSLILMPGEKETPCTCKVCQSELVQVHYLWNRETGSHIKKGVVN